MQTASQSSYLATDTVCQWLSGYGAGTISISITWELVRNTTFGPHLKGWCFPSTLSPNTCPAQRPFPCGSKSEQAGLPLLSVVKTLTQCQHLQSVTWQRKEATLVWSQDGSDSICCSHWPAVTEASCEWPFLRKKLCQAGR